MQCLATENQVELLFIEKQLTVHKAIDGTKLKKLEKTLGERDLTKVITYMLLRFSESFNVGKKLTTGQAPLIAIDLIEKYPYETIEDILLMLKQVRQGILGDGKDFKLDGQNILNKWMPEYLDKKYEQVERDNKAIQTSHAKDLEDKNHPVTVFYRNQKIKKAREEAEKKAKSEIDDMVKNMDRQVLEDTITDWEKKPEMQIHLQYLKSKRQFVKGRYQ
jgi:hypothetical protein